jgi:hypothetical protein
MVLRLGRKTLPKRSPLPWESIDSGDRVLTTEPQADAEGKWFLDAPPGQWAMAGDAEEEDDANLSDDAFDLETGEEEEYPFPAPGDGGGWTVAALCMGLGIIAACLIIPQTDANRRLVYQREKLRLDLRQIQSQIAVDKEFLAKVETDPQLTERLAQREMRAVPRGEMVLDVNSAWNPAVTATLSAQRMSPFMIVNVPAPAALPPYRPVGGNFAALCRDPGSHSYLLGGGMFLVAAGLVLGGPGKTRDPAMIPPQSDDQSPPDDSAGA